MMGWWRTPMGLVLTMIVLALVLVFILRTIVVMV